MRKLAFTNGHNLHFIAVAILSEETRMFNVQVQMAAGLRYVNQVTGLSSSFGLGSSQCVYPDLMLTPFNIGIGVVVNSSNVTYNVEATMDYTGSSAFISSNATWFVNSGFSSQSSNATGNYAFPVTAMRLNVTAVSSTGTATMTAIQAGGI